MKPDTFTRQEAKHYHFFKVCYFFKNKYKHPLDCKTDALILIFFFKYLKLLIR